MRSILMALVLVAVVLAGCTSNDDDSDSDNDGLTDLDERTGWTITVETPDSRYTRTVYSDPKLPDTDFDGVPDVFEFALGTDPTDPDTDQDGLSDCQELRHTVRSECEDPEWDGQADGGYKTEATMADSDASSSRYVNARRDLFAHRLTDAQGLIARGDGLLDGDEVAGYTITLPSGATRHVTLNPLKVDTDGDFLEDAEEILIYGTDPTVADTDGDGCEDGFDPLPRFAEAFALGLEKFTWTESGRSGSTHIAITGSIADRAVYVPDAATAEARHGQALDLKTFSVPARPAAACSYQPSNPWVRIDLQVAEFDAQGNYLGPLDVHSKVVPDGFSIWWNVAEDHFRWALKTGAPFTSAGPITWEGEDGSIVFRPAVVSR